MAEEGLSGQEVLGIDAGTQGLSIILWCPLRHKLLAQGESQYEQDYIPDLAQGHLEQYASYWTDAMRVAMSRLRENLKQNTGHELKGVAAIGITGHMHCMVRRASDETKPWGCDMWNDGRGVAESIELSDVFGEHIPQRWTASHILARIRSSPAEWQECVGVTVTSGSLLHDLSGAWVLGPGDASGMFGKLSAKGQIDVDKLAKMDQLTAKQNLSLCEMVPKTVVAGQVAARLNKFGAELLGSLPEGIPIAAPEGDQQSTLTVSGARVGELALSAGTSFTGNMPCKKSVVAKNERMNVLATPDALTMLMVCVRNGTVAFGQYVEGLAEFAGQSFSKTADDLTVLATKVASDVYGAELLPFFQGENVVELPYAKAAMTELNLDCLSNPGAIARLLLEAPCHTLKYGLEQLEKEAEEVKCILLSGGALKSKDGFAPQLFADVLGVPVKARLGDEEGTAKGAAYLAAYMAECEKSGQQVPLADFVKEQSDSEEVIWHPNPELRVLYSQRYQSFKAKIEQMKT